MLFRNLSPKLRLVNGTKAIVRRYVSNYVIECEPFNVDGALTGNCFLLPRINMIFTMPNTGVDILRRQFPIMLAYAHTMNKSQGQTLFRVGIDIRDNAFSHGQQFVSFSRATSSDNVVVFTRGNDRTFVNVVLTDLLK